MSARRWTSADALRVLAVLLLLAQAGIHLQQYEGPLRAVPTINALFVLNAVGAAAIALVLAGSRGSVSVVASLAGLGITLGALVSLAVSRSATLFAYSEPTLRAAVLGATVVELAVVLALAAFLVVRRGGRGSGPRLDWSQPG